MYGEINGSGGSNAGRAKNAGYKVSREDVRDLCNGGAFTDTPHRQQSGEQFTREPDDALRCLPHEMALGTRQATNETAASEEMQSGWLPDTCEAQRALQHTPLQIQEERESELDAKDDKREMDGSRFVGWWQQEPNVGRVTNVSKDRVAQLKGLGNAQVPIQAATAFRLLSVRQPT